MTPVNAVHGAEAALRAWSLRSLGLAVVHVTSRGPLKGARNCSAGTGRDTFGAMPEPSSQIRDRASDWLVIGPVVGFTTQTSTRVLVQPFESHRDQLELRLVKAAPGARFDAAAERRTGENHDGSQHSWQARRKG